MTALSPHVKRLAEISEEFEFAYAGVSKRADHYFKLVANGRRVPSAGIYFRFTSQSNAAALRKKLKLEIERKYTLELIGAFEAKLVYYFRNIVKRRHALHLAYCNIVPDTVKRGGAHLMFHHIMPVFKQELQPDYNIAYSNFKGLIEYRNWLAHDRGWDFETHLLKFDFAYSYQTIEAIISLLPNFPAELA